MKKGLVLWPDKNKDREQDEKEAPDERCLLSPEEEFWLFAPCRRGEPVEKQDQYLGDF